MVKKNYHFEFKDEKKIAKAFSSNTRASLKFSLEIARELKGMLVEKAEAFLQDVVDQKRFLPLRKYNTHVAHRRGKPQSFVKSGRYPKNTCKVVLSLLNSVKANADYKGLNAENLIIEHMFASQGYARQSHQTQGRIAGKARSRKSTHLEIVVREAS